jgi:hypothetical protein
VRQTAGTVTMNHTCLAFDMSMAVVTGVALAVGRNVAEVDRGRLIAVHALR